ncbi:hypothetical protein [Oenococcus sp.]|uniref:hypothetical protein n=1 Tax=Oenococcus sp. TaxID=1979414 RepID=UPI0039E995C6
MTTLVSNMAKLRNDFRNGHEQITESSILLAKYTHLVISSVIILIRFLLETSHERK